VGDEGDRVNVGSRVISEIEDGSAVALGAILVGTGSVGKSVGVDEKDEPLS
jgi:hypothetical protein